MAVVRNKDLPRVTSVTAGDTVTLDGATSRSITFENFTASITASMLGNGASGIGAVVLVSNATLIAPTLGVAAATSINKVAITAPATGATLTLPDGVTLTGPAASGTAMTLGNAETVTGVKTFGSTGAVGRLKLAGTTSGTTTLDASATASGTLTLPAATDTLVGKATPDTFTNKTFDTAGTGNSLSINGVAATANTGTGAVVRATSPTLVTPAIGVATATSLNGNFWTVGTGTLTLGAGKTATISNTLTFTGTDGSTAAFGAGGTVAYTANKLSAFAATTSAELAGVISDETGSGSLVFASAPTLVNPVVGTQTPGDNTTKAASTAFVTAAVVASTTGVASVGGQTGALSFDGGAMASTVMTVPRYDAAQSLTAAQHLQLAANIGIVPESGRLTWVSATALKFSPKNGDLVKINGSVYRIPNAGIAGPANTGVFVNGTGASNLGASTVYYVYAFINSGTVTADFRTDGNGHLPSDTAGNEGVEVRVSTGTTKDDSRTLIGMIRTNSSAQFTDFLTLSWFNRRNKGAQGSGNGNGSIAPITFISWADESVTLGFSGSIQCNIASTNNASHYVDGATVGLSVQDTVTTATYYSSYASAIEYSISETVHTYSTLVAIAGGGTDAPFQTSVRVRG